VSEVAIKLFNNVGKTLCAHFEYDDNTKNATLEIEIKKVLKHYKKYDSQSPWTRVFKIRDDLDFRNLWFAKDINGIILELFLKDKKLLEFSIHFPLEMQWFCGDRYFGKAIWIILTASGFRKV